MRLRLHFFFFFFHAFVRLVATVHALCMNSSHKVQLFLPFFSQLVHTVHCSWTHKFHFSATFSLKMGSTVPFTHLKIILLQCFSVFSFSFQFSAVSKRTLSDKKGTHNGGGGARQGQGKSKAKRKKKDHRKTKELKVLYTGYFFVSSLW